MPGTLARRLLLVSYFCFFTFWWESNPVFHLWILSDPGPRAPRTFLLARLDLIYAAVCQEHGQVWCGGDNGMYFVDFDFSHRQGFAPWHLRIALMCAGVSAVRTFVDEAQLAAGLTTGQRLSIHASASARSGRAIGVWRRESLGCGAGQ